jgi:hypothetical protein
MMLDVFLSGLQLLKMRFAFSNNSDILNIVMLVFRSCLNDYACFLHAWGAMRNDGRPVGML